MANIIDPEAVNSMISDVGPEATERLYGIFDKECKTYAESLCRHLDAGDDEQLFVIAHSLKSSARQFGAAALAGMSKELEHLSSTASSDRKGIARAVANILDEIEVVRPGLAGLSFVDGLSGPARP